MRWHAEIQLTLTYRGTSARVDPDSALLAAFVAALETIECVRAAWHDERAAADKHNVIADFDFDGDEPAAEKYAFEDLYHRAMDAVLVTAGDDRPDGLGATVSVQPFESVQPA